MTAQAFKIHSEFPSLTEDLKNGTTPIPLSYSHSELSQLLISNASQPALPKLSEAQCQFITQSLQSSKSYKPEELKSLLEATFNVFDDAFYFGLLKRHIDLDVRTICTNQKNEVPDGRDPVQGFYTEHWENIILKGARTPKKLCPSDGQKPAIVMMLFHTPCVPDNKCPEQFNQEQVGIWIGALVHEMLHGFLGIFSCICWKKCYPEYVDSALGVGFTGHGALFCETMEVIGDACLSQLGLQGVNCGIYDSAYEEISSTAWRPTDDQISRWALEYKIIEKQIKRWESFAAKGVDAVKNIIEKMEAVLEACERRQPGLTQRANQMRP